MTPLVAAAFLLWIALTGLHDIPLICTGLILSFCLDRIMSISLPWKQFVSFLWLLIKAIFIAYKEAFNLVLSRKYRRGYLTERIHEASPWTIFTRVFLVTLTPKTVAIHVDHLDEVLIHRFEEDNK
jgi:multisubunit Na+/H+ antiporter MnhE subunit